MQSQKLTELRIKNEERRTRKALIERSSPDLAAELSNATWHYSLSFPPAYKWETSFFPNDNILDPGANRSPDRPDDYHYFDFDDYADLKEKAAAIPTTRLPDTTAFLMTGNFNDPMPIFEQSLHTFFHHLSEMLDWGEQKGMICIITRESPAAGLLVTSYTGYLSEDRMTNSNETVYELSYWGLD